MKKSHLMTGALAITAAATILALAEPALAAKAKEISEGMKIWNLTWRILNFLLLAGLIFKLGKEPFKKFLASKKASYAEEIETIENAKKEAQEKLDEIQQKIAGLQDELDAYRQAMERQAQRQRDEMIAATKREADLIIERAKNQASRALEKAKRDLAIEMVDLAVDIASQKISAAITSEDRANLLNSFASQLAANRG